MTEPDEDPRVEAQPDVLTGGVIFTNPEVLHGEDEHIVHSAGPADQEPESDGLENEVPDMPEPKGYEWAETGEGGWVSRPYY